MKPPLFFSLPGNESLGAAIAARLSAELGKLTARRFPDGESYVRLESDPKGRSVIFLCTLDRPDEKFLPLLFAAETARDLGAARLGLIAPYLSYMRQDARFQPGEGITSTYFAKAVSRSFDWLLTVDPHLHRRESLSEIYEIPARAVHAAPALSVWIGKNVKNPLVIGPDEESRQWAQAVAGGNGAPAIVLEKKRLGDRKVEVSAPEAGRYKGRTAVLVDDIISTGQTMVAAVKHLIAEGFPSPLCLGVHGVFAQKAYEDLLTAGAGAVVTANTIIHPSNQIDVSELLAKACEEFVGG
ncbi:MAG: ribose-phosphate pyrophosphokinase [Bdellovibrionota bacterium]